MLLCCSAGGTENMYLRPQSHDIATGTARADPTGNTCSSGSSQSVPCRAAWTPGSPLCLTLLRVNDRFPLRVLPSPLTARGGERELRLR